MAGKTKKAAKTSSTKAAKAGTTKKSASAKSAAKPASKVAAKAKTTSKATAKAEPKKAAKAPTPSPADKRKAQAAAALKAALEDTSNESKSSGEEEFDPAAFFAASGGKGIFRAHVMRKERVDFNLGVRYRLNGPLVHSAELLNLSKGGLCLKTPEIIKNKAVVRIEIPLPHTSELFAIQAEVIWSDYVAGTKGKDRPIHTGLRFLPMSLAKQSVINTFIQQRRDEIIMSKIGLDKFRDSVPVAGLD